MKTCPSRLQLEAAALNEVPEGRVAEVESHANGCARCRHELNWLRTESSLFAQRTAREEVSRLWEGFEAGSAPRRGHRTVRAVLAVAASLLIAMVVGGRLSPGHRGGSSERGEQPAMSLEMMSVDWQPGTPASMPCYTPGHGIACGEVEYASR